MSIYLYVKQCPHCGLKYFGKTEQDPYTYNGSGKMWIPHIKKHKVTPKTIELYEFSDKEEAKKFAINFSKENRIVESKEWFNLVIEQCDGGDTSASPAFQRWIDQIDMAGEKNPMYGRSAITEQNLRWYTNGENNLYLPVGTEMLGYRRGRTIKHRKPYTQEHKDKISKANTGKKSVNQKTCISPDGNIYESITQAANAHSMTVSAFRHKIEHKEKHLGWIIV